MAGKVHPLLERFRELPQGDEFAVLAHAVPLGAFGRERLIRDRQVRVEILCQDPGAVATLLDREKLAPEAVFEMSPGPSVVLGALPVEFLRRLDESNKVHDVTPSTKAQRHLDLSVPVLWDVASAAAMSSQFTGKDVLIGIVDTGIDWQHVDFQSAGKTRIEQLLVQDGAQQTVFAAQEIDKALKGGPAVPGDDDPEGEGHGTHVAGIAAGNGTASGGKFRGVAPDTRLLFVRTDFDTNNIQRGVDWIFKNAVQPAVVNLSLGSHLGPHDGTSAMDRALESLTGPGKIIVASAGNEGVDGIHAGTRMASNSRFVADLVLNKVERTGSAAALIDVWIARADSVQVTVRTPSGELVSANTRMQRTRWTVTVSQRVSPLNGDTNVFVQIQVPVAKPDLLRGWSLIFESQVIQDGRVHAWIVDSALGRFAGGATKEYLVGQPATSRGVISVAASATKATWQSQAGQMTAQAIKVGDIAFFSSPGPSRDRRKKPEITCPGQMIMSARSYQIQTHPDLTDPSGSYQAMQGTSMSAPHLVGAIALLLEKKGALTPSEVLADLQAACMTDPFTGVTWNERWGFGKLDLAKLV